MLEALNDIVLMITDPLLGWLLYLPRDLAIIIIAVGTSAILTFSRLLATDQEKLARCDADKKRIAELMKKAKKEGDKEAVARYRATTAAIAMKLMNAEGKPLLVAILPIALLGIWCWGRIGFYPPSGGEKVELMAYMPASALGKLAHLIPRKGLQAENWIARIKATPDAIPGQECMAVWEISGEARPEEPYGIQMVYGGVVHDMDFLVGSRKYSPNTRFFNEKNDRITAAEMALKPYWFLGFLHIPWGMWDYFIFPWLLAYLLIAAPFVFILKALFNIH